MLQDTYGSVPAPGQAHLERGYGTPANRDSAYMSGGGPAASDFASNPNDSSPLSQSLPNRGRVGDDYDHTRDSTLIDGDMQRSTSNASTLAQGTPSRGGTLKKKNSVKRSASLKRSGSKRSLRAGSIKGVQMDEGASRDYNNVFHVPIPTTGTPTDVLVDRFQAWRKLLKDLITYFREIQTTYDHRSKALLKVSNVINNTDAPPTLLGTGGLSEATRILRDYHKLSTNEANKARDIENEVVTQLNGLRADLGQKIKEIKSLSGDFKNSVDKERDTTRKAVAALEDALQAYENDPTAVVGKGDPYVVRLGVDRQVERQIDEENYLHRAYLNLEGSGRELESIVVGEIQKAYNAFAGILKREADESYDAVEKLRSGPIALPKDNEWSRFVEHDPHFVNPKLPLRRIDDVEYPGKHHPAAAEVRAGMLERKSKYLKSYTPGWYVLSATHLHEFKSADRIYTQPPVMSLYLLDQKLGSKSDPGSSSHKFMLKGRQTGGMHRGHSWVFRAETYDTMLAWYEDIRALTEKTGAERTAFVRSHARSISAGSHKSIESSDGGMEEDEADNVPYSAQASLRNNSEVEAPKPQRPSPGGRFPSDLNANRHLREPLSPSSGFSEPDQDLVDNDLSTAAGGLGAGAILGSTAAQHREQPYQQQQPIQRQSEQPSDASHQPGVFGGATTAQEEPLYSQRYSNNAGYDAPATAAYPQQPAVAAAPVPAPYSQQPAPAAPVQAQPNLAQARSPQLHEDQPGIARHSSTYGDWMTPAAGGAAVGAAGGALGADAYRRHHDAAEQLKQQQAQQVPQEMPTESGVAERHPEHTMQREPEGLASVSEPSEMTSSTAPTSYSSHNPTQQSREPFLGEREAAVPAVIPGPAPHRTTESNAPLPQPTTTGPATAAGVSNAPAPVSAGPAGQYFEKEHYHVGKEDAQPTGHIFPSVIRHNTNMSVSDLPVPGQYPQTPGL